MKISSIFFLLLFNTQLVNRYGLQRRGIKMGIQIIKDLFLSDGILLNQAKRLIWN